MVSLKNLLLLILGVNSENTSVILMNFIVFDRRAFIWNIVSKEAVFFFV